MKITLTKSEAEAMLASRFDVLQHEVSIELPVAPVAPAQAPDFLSVTKTITDVRDILTVATGGNLIDTTKELRKRFTGLELPHAVRIAKLLLGRTD